MLMSEESFSVAFYCGNGPFLGHEFPVVVCLWLNSSAFLDFFDDIVSLVEFAFP